MKIKQQNRQSVGRTYPNSAVVTSTLSNWE